MFGTSPKSHHVDDTGSSPVRAEIFTGYPAAKVHIGLISNKLSCGPVAEGFMRRTLASCLGPLQNPTTWTTRDRVPYAPKYSQTTTRQKYIWVKFPINCRVARWPRGLGDGFETHECQVCWTDSTCGDLWSMGMSVHKGTVSQSWVNCPNASEEARG